MNLVGRFKYLGIEDGVTRDGKSYTRMGILQGLNSELLYPSDEIVAKMRNVPPMTDIDCSLRITVNSDKKAYVNIDDITVVK